MKIKNLVAAAGVAMAMTFAAALPSHASTTTALPAAPDGTLDPGDILQGAKCFSIPGCIGVNETILAPTAFSDLWSVVVGTSGVYAAGSSSYTLVKPIAGFVVQWLDSAMNVLASSVPGTNPGLVTATLLAGQTYYVGVGGTAQLGSTYTVNVEASAIPVPGALPLLATGLVGLGFLTRRRKAS